MSRTETDYIFYDKTTYSMEPVYQKPNMDNYMDDWNISTFSDRLYTDSKILSVFHPEYMYERNWDYLYAREEERLLFGDFDVSELSLNREYDDRWYGTRAFGFVWQNYYHW